MPKVVFVNRFFHPDLSATSQMLTDLAFRLTAAGVEVHVIASRQLYEDAGASLPPSEIVRGVRVHRVWTARFGRKSLRGRALDYLSFYLTASARLWTVLRAGDVAVVKTDPPMLSVVGAVAVALRGAKLVNWLQDVFPEVASRLGVAAVAQPFETGLQALRDRSLSFAKANVVLGTRMRSYLASRDIDASSLRIIENWSDGDTVHPLPAARSELRTRLGLQDHFVVGYSGNLGRAHEVDTLLAAAETLRDDPTIVFLMVGGGAKMHELRERVDQAQLPNFRFLPYQQRELLADSLAASDVHLASLLPSLEGLIVPSKMYGILAAGRPCIFIGDVDGEIARLLREAQCGESVACGAAEELANLIRMFQQDPVEMQRMGDCARATFDTRFTLDHAVNRWMLLLGELNVRSEGGAPAPLSQECTAAIAAPPP